MGFGRKVGKLMLGVSRGAKKMGEGFDMVFGEDRTRPGDGFSKERAGRRAGEFTRQAKSKDKTSGFMEKNKDREYFGSGSKSDEDDSREFF
jgi:hypothetical protein